MRNFFANLVTVLGTKLIVSARRFKHWRAERKAFWDPETLAWHEDQLRKYQQRPKPGEGRP